MPLWPGAPYEYAAVAGDFVYAAGAKSPAAKPS